MSQEKDYCIHIHYTVHDDVIDETVSVTEEVYRTYKRSYWNDDKQRERESRCIIPGKNGPRRCNQDCSKCNKFRTGRPYSIEEMDAQGMDIADQNIDIEEAVIYSELLEALMDALEELDPDKRAIAKAIMAGKDDRTAAEELGYAAQSSYSYQKLKLLKSLKERLDKYR